MPAVAQRPGRRRQSPDDLLLENDGSRPQKAYAADDLSRYAARIELHVGSRKHAGESVLRNDHKQRAAQRDQKMRAETGLFGPVLAVESDDGAQTPASNSRHAKSQNMPRSYDIRLSCKCKKSGRNIQSLRPLKRSSGEGTIPKRKKSGPGRPKRQDFATKSDGKLRSDSRKKKPEPAVARAGIGAERISARGSPIQALSPMSDTRHPTRRPDSGRIRPFGYSAPVVEPQG